MEDAPNSTIAQRLTVARPRFGHEKSRFRALEAALLNAWDVVPDQNSLAVNMSRFLHASLQKCVMDFFIGVLEHVRTKWLVYHANMSEHCIFSRPQCVSDMKINAELSLKGWNILRLCLSLVPMITLPLAIPRVVTVIEMPLAALVCLRLNV